MRHVVKAWQNLPLGNQDPERKFFIEIENGDEDSGVAPIVKFTIQSDPVSEVGVNGCQAVDMLEYVKHLFESLNESFPCPENIDTISAIDVALTRQHDRTKDREERKVEGKNLA